MSELLDILGHIIVTISICYFLFSLTMAIINI